MSLAERADYLGNESCAPCHQEEFRSHAGSYHDRALSVVDGKSHGARFETPTNVRDPKRDLEYTTGVRDGACMQWVRSQGVVSGVQAKYGVGAGKHGITYLGERENRTIELRLSFYPGSKKWDFSPGQQVNSISGGVLYPEGLVKAPDVIEECFVCHTTGLVKEGGRIQPEKSILGVGCESCHGPGREHVSAIKQGRSDIKMARLLQARDRITVELCGKCHRSPAGEDIHDPFNKSQMPRLQGLALVQSACFTNSGGRLSCLSCHSAHGDATETRVKHNATCVSCHQGSRPNEGACPIEPRGDCVSCHMPEQGVGMPTGLKYRNHWIKAWR
ncbi:MAG: multiheme c-type cytochrome [Actinomycetota bacterium]